MRLIWKNLLRKPLRTFLTVFGVAIALFLFCMLESVLQAFNAGVAMADAKRLVVQHKESLSFVLPFSHQGAIEQIQGVQKVSGAVWFGGPYDNEQPNGEKKEEFFAQFAVDMEKHFSMYPELKIPPAQLKELMEDRRGCLIGDKIAERIHKKVGDRLTLRGTIWSRSDGKPWEFTVRAIYTTDSPTFDRTLMYFHLKYFDESREFGKGTCGIFVAGIDDPNQYQHISSEIDTRFANSPYETRTMTEKAFTMQFVSMMGNLQLLLRSIGSAVVLTMLLVAANTMMMSARERTREMGILKSIGYTDTRIFLLLIGEALTIGALGCLFGAGGSHVLINMLQFNPKPDFFPVFYLPHRALWWAVAIAAITALISGLGPAIAGMRLKATEALRSM